MAKVVVTGGSRGIGYAIAAKYVSEGHQVFITSKHAGHLRDAEATLMSRFRTKAVVSSVCDMADKEDVQRLGKEILRTWGSPDILVNNAGTFMPGTIYEEEDGAFETVMAVNVAGPYHLVRTLLPSMMDRRSGHIVNMCSTASLTGYPNGGTYCISKHALLGMSRELREELKPFRIGVTAILPGAVWTDSWKGSGLPENRFITPGQVADLVYQCTSLGGAAVVEELLVRPMRGDVEAE